MASCSSGSLTQRGSATATSGSLTGGVGTATCRKPFSMSSDGEGHAQNLTLVSSTE